MQARTPDSLDPLHPAEGPEEVKPLVISLNDLLARLKAALDAQRAFVADAAHELRTPLTALQLQFQHVERATSLEQKTAALGEFRNGLQRTTHAVQQLLTLARQEPVATEYRLVTVSQADLVRRFVVEHQRLAEVRQIDLGVTEAEPAAVVSGDADALRILLANFVGNALRYTPRGRQVDVSCRIGNGRPCLEVADSGPGIPAA